MVKAIESILPVSKQIIPSASASGAAVEHNSEDISEWDTQRLGQQKPVKGTLLGTSCPFGFPPALPA